MGLLFLSCKNFEKNFLKGGVDVDVRENQSSGWDLGEHS